MKVPFDKEGNLLNYVSTWSDRQGLVEWRDNYTLIRALKFIRFVQNHSTVGILLWDVDTEVNYYMFMSEFEKLIHYYKLDRGVTEYLEWTFRKQGSYYSICLARENEES